MKRYEDYAHFIDPIYHWCCNEYGFSKYQKDFPTISVDRRGKVKLGYFDYTTNHIHIYLNTHDFLSELIDTIIHEWTHYLQSPTWLTRYNKSYNYLDNPYEIRACRIAERDKMKCFYKILDD
jgi:Zn-dependent peptidase ImmA (M78 family)